MGGFPDRYIALYASRTTIAAGHLSIVALAGCRVGRVRRHPTSPVIAAELLFGAPTLPGQHHVFEYEVIDRSHATNLRYGRFVPDGTASSVISVAFHPDRPPARCYGQTGRTARHELPLSPDLVAHLVTLNPPPGILEVSWEWSEEADFPPVPAQ